MSLSDGEEAALARRILRWAILNNVSIRALHQPSFSDIFDPLVQHFKLPSRQTMLSTMLRNEYLQARARAQQALSDPSVKSFCLCIDGWVSLRQQRHLGGTALTPHPIFVMLPFAESAGAIAAALRQIINSDLFIYTKEVRPGVIAKVDLRTKTSVSWASTPSRRPPRRLADVPASERGAKRRRRRIRGADHWSQVPRVVSSSSDAGESSSHEVSGAAAAAAAASTGASTEQDADIDDLEDEDEDADAALRNMTQLLGVLEDASFDE